MSKKKIISAIAVILSSLMMSSCGKYSKGDKLLAQAVKEYEEKEYSTALETLNQAEEDGLKSSGEESLHFYLGETYFKLGDYEKSLEEHKKTVEIKPDTFKSYVTMGVCYRKLGDDNKALDTYSKALLHDPENADSVGLYISLGSIYIENNKPYTAIDYLEKASEIYPEQPAAHAFLSIAYAMSYEYEKSDAELELAKTYGYDNIDLIKERINKVKSGQNN